jgi:2-hydroxy-3-keto-5-methylthiopentenyl-1-phosphate phosphatase
VAKINVVFDFDGTLATEFVGGLMFRGYTPDDKVVVARERFVSGKTTLREYQEEVFDLVGESPAVMSQRAVEGTTIRSAAQEICQVVWDAGGSVAVASAGLDFYIQPVLDRAGLGRIDVHSGRVVSDPTALPPFRYDYPSADENCKGDWITCKCKVINDLKSSEVECEVIFVGDGTGADPCAATDAADTVFASGRLLTYCNENDIPATEFGDDLGPVLSYVKSKTVANGAQ